jgi:hypothetical protein
MSAKDNTTDVPFTCNIKWESLIQTVVFSMERRTCEVYICYKFNAHNLYTSWHQYNLHATMFYSAVSGTYSVCNEKWNIITYRTNHHWTQIKATRYELKATVSLLKCLSISLKVAHYNRSTFRYLTVISSNEFLVSCVFIFNYRFFGQYPSPHF